MPNDAARKAIRRDRSRLKQLICDWEGGKFSDCPRHVLVRKKAAIERLQARLSELDDPGLREAWLEWKIGDPLPVCMEELKRPPVSHPSPPPKAPPTSDEIEAERTKRAKALRKKKLSYTYLYRLKRSIYRYYIPSRRPYRRKPKEKTLLRKIQQYQKICLSLDADKSAGMVWTNWEPGEFVPLPETEAEVQELIRKYKL